MNIFSNKNNIITYTVNKESTRDLCISVQNGEVVINAPWYITSSQIQRVVEEKRQWILNKIKEYEIACEQKNIYTKLKTVKVLGNDYDIVISYKKIDFPSLNFVNNQIQVILPIKFKKIESSDIVNTLMNKM